MPKKDKENVLAAKILANENRQKILTILSNTKVDLCVNQISKLTNISQSLASHQLAYLSAYGLLKSYRVGQTVCYIKSDSAFAKKVFKVLKVLSN